jgi:hypothetical protein
MPKLNKKFWEELTAYFLLIRCGRHTKWHAQKFLYLRFEVFTAVTMKNAVFCDMAPCSYCVNRRLGGTYRLHFRAEEKKKKIRERGTNVSRWLQQELTNMKHNFCENYDKHSDYVMTDNF